MAPKVEAKAKANPPLGSRCGRMCSFCGVMPCGRPFQHWRGNQDSNCRCVASLSGQSCESIDQVAIAELPQIEAKAKAKAKAKAAPVVIVPVVGEWTVVLQSLLVRGFLGNDICSMPELVTVDKEWYTFWQTIRN